MEPFSQRLRALQSREIYYMSWDHPNAHELTNHIRYPLPALGLRSPGALAKALRMRWGIVPVSPTGTTGSLPRLHGNDVLVQDRFLVVKLIYHSRSNRLQPTYNKTIRHNCNNRYNTHNLHYLNKCNSRYKTHNAGMGNTVQHT